MSKKLNEQEVQERFLNHVRFMVEYWGEGLDEVAKSKLSGLAFSILSAIDGCSSDLPPFILAPLCTKEDVKFYKEQDMDYYPISPKVECDIAATLHENFHK